MLIDRDHRPSPPRTLRQIWIEQGAINGHDARKRASSDWAISERLSRLEDRRLEAKLRVDQASEKKGVVDIALPTSSRDGIEPKAVANRLGKNHNKTACAAYPLRSADKPDRSTS